MTGSLRHVTMFIMVFVAIFLAVYDLFPFWDKSRGDTISEVMLYWSMHCFTLPCVFGTLAGHFFIPRDGHYPKPNILLAILVTLIILDVVVGVLGIAILQTIQSHPVIAFSLGVPIGPLFWPQQREDKL
jgi:hypothetical protein